MTTVLAEEDVTGLCAKHPDTGLRLARRVEPRVLAGTEIEATLSVPQTDAVASEGDGDDVTTQVVTVCDDDGSGQGSDCTGGNDMILYGPTLS